MANGTLVEVVNRSTFEGLFSDPNFQQYSVPKEWIAWEASHILSMFYVMESSDTITLIEEGCQTTNGGTNCTEACGNATTMFDSYDTLWNCLTLVAASNMAIKSPGWMDDKSENDANEIFHFGSVEEFDSSGDVFYRYFDCATQSCMDSRFGKCPDEFMRIRNNDSIGYWTLASKLGQVMTENYCQTSEPGIDFDIAGPGIVLAYFIQFGLVFFFALSYKLITAWVKNVTWAFSLPFSPHNAASKRASAWQQSVSKGRFPEAISSSIVDVQETQALLLTTIAGATIATFTGRPGTGLGNIQTLSSWLTNSVILKGMVTAGSYPLLLLQIILHRCGRRWWYTLLFIAINAVLVAVIESYRRPPQGEALLDRLRETARLNDCGNNLGPRTFCLPFTSYSGEPEPDGGKVSIEKPVDPQLYLSFNSRNQQPVYILTGFLILDWLICFFRARKSRKTPYSKVAAENDRARRSRGYDFVFAKRIMMILLQGLWIAIEAMAFTMCILGLVEFAAFLKVLKDEQNNGKSAINISEWSFGQLIAVAVWLPAVSKFLSLLIDQDGLQQRIDTRYTITKDIPKTDNGQLADTLSDSILLVPKDASRSSIGTELDIVAPEAR